MLTFLQINDFILINSFKGNFKKGFTTITGETGAGKSMILNALDLVSGKKLNINTEKNIKNKSDIIAAFDISKNKKVKDILIEKELLVDDSCILRRVIYKDGKNNAFINNIKVNLKDLSLISSYLFEIHSQDSTREIINTENQVKIIDSFCSGLEHTLNLKKITEDYYDTKNIIEGLLLEKEKNISEFQLLEYKYKELKILNLEENEYKNLSIELKDLENAKDYILNSEKILSIIYNDSDISIDNLLNNIIKTLNELNEDKKNISESKIMINDIKEILKEFNKNIEKERDSYSLDEEKLFEIANRIKNIEDIAKKNNIFPDDLYEYAINIINKYENYDKPSLDVEELKEKLKLLKEEWFDIANKLSFLRKSNVSLFKEKVTSILQDLKMEGSEIDIKFEDLSHQINKYGLEKPEIMIKTNVGQNFDKLDKVLSGGEASRVTLAIQSLLNNNLNQPTLIFDEIDTGTGGNTANMIGKYMLEISKNTQLICITHLPQVALFSDNHFIVKKNPRNSENITDVMIEECNDNDFILELGRMLGYEIINTKIKEQIKEQIKNTKEGVLVNNK